MYHLVDKVVVLRAINNHWVLRPTEVNNWTQRDEIVKLILEISVAFGQSWEHLRCPLWMTNITQLLLLCLLQDKVNLSWSVMLAKLVKAVIIVFIRSHSLGGLPICISGSSVVPKPNIVANFSCLESRRVLFIHYPSVCVWKKPMLKENYRRVFRGLWWEQMEYC